MIICTLTNVWVGTEGNCFANGMFFFLFFFPNDINLRQGYLLCKWYIYWTWMLFSSPRWRHLCYSKSINFQKKSFSMLTQHQCFPHGIEGMILCYISTETRTHDILVIIAALLQCASGLLLVEYANLPNLQPQAILQILFFQKREKVFWKSLPTVLQIKRQCICKSCKCFFLP